MATKRKINVKLLRKVKRHILLEPKRLNMGCFIARKDELQDDPLMYPVKFPSCGTVGCIAGWAVALSTEKKLKYGRIEGAAKRLLGLTPRQAYYLFYDEDGIVTAAPQTVWHARQTAKLIDHFIETERG
jgi:hypothetical protein